MFSAQISVQNLCANHSHPPCTQIVIEKLRRNWCVIISLECRLATLPLVGRIAEAKAASFWQHCQHLATLPEFGNLAPRVGFQRHAFHFGTGLPTTPMGWTAALPGTLGDQRSAYAHTLDSRADCALAPIEMVRAILRFVALGASRIMD